jgi:hypothetical protein
MRNSGRSAAESMRYFARQASAERHLLRLEVYSSNRRRGAADVISPRYLGDAV